MLQGHSTLCSLEMLCYPTCPGGDFWGKDPADLQHVSWVRGGTLGCLGVLRPQGTDPVQNYQAVWGTDGLGGRNGVSWALGSRCQLEELIVGHQWGQVNSFPRGKLEGRVLEDRPGQGPLQESVPSTLLLPTLSGTKLLLPSFKGHY